MRVLLSGLSPRLATALDGRRRPIRPTDAEWPALYAMLCDHCVHQLSCPITERLIEAKDGAAPPTDGWVTDPGAGVTCLSYAAKKLRPVSRQRLRAIARMDESALPLVCAGCAARKGSEASVSLHTRRDFEAAVRARALFVCHEDPAHEQPCGGWCRAIRRRARSAGNDT
jgi:hypothetical protein